VVGFFDTYRQLYPVSCDTLRGYRRPLSAVVEGVVSEAQYPGPGSAERPPRRIRRTVLQGRGRRLSRCHWNSRLWRIPSVPPYRDRPGRPAMVRFRLSKGGSGRQTATNRHAAEPGAAPHPVTDGAGGALLSERGANPHPQRGSATGYGPIRTVTRSQTAQASRESSNRQSRLGGNHENQRRRDRPHPAARRRNRSHRLCARLHHPRRAIAWIGWIGVMPLLTALVGSRPLYSMVGLSTRPAHKRKGKRRLAGRAPRPAAPRASLGARATFLSPSGALFSSQIRRNRFIAPRPAPPAAEKRRSQPGERCSKEP